MKRRLQLLLPLLVLGSLLSAAPAQANFILGIGDQNASMFENKLWKDLRLKKARYVTSWDTALDPSELAKTEGYLGAARKARQEVLVHFSAKPGCYQAPRYLKTSACKAPTVKRYTAAFKAFKKKFPFVKVYGAWNEANHISQPISRKTAGATRGPKLAAQYYTALKKNCRKCKVVAGDLLSQSDMIPYAKAMNKALKGRAKLWGLHNYPDVNRKPKKGKRTGTELLLRTVPGEVWVTETGGIVSFDGAKGFKPSEKAADTALKRIFSIANKFDSKRRGNKSRITRLYPYNFIEAQNARFDAGLLTPDGKPRKAYTTFKKAGRKARK